MLNQSLLQQQEDVQPASSLWRKHALNTGRRFQSKHINFEELNDRSIDHISKATQHNSTNHIVITDTSGKRDVARILKIKKQQQQKSSSGVKDAFDKVSIDITTEFLQESPISSLCWNDNSLLMGGANDGQIFLYNCKDDSGTFREEPTLAETYTITRLKGVKNMVYPVGAMGVDSAIKAVEINSLQSKQFACLENNAFHIWEFSNPVQPVVSFRASEMPLNVLSWSPHSRHYAAVGGAPPFNTVMLLDQRLMSTFRAKRNPIVWSSEINNSSTTKQGTCQAIAWHPFVPYWLATGNDNGVIDLWDLRSINKPVVSVFAHYGALSQLQWCPTHSELLVSAGYDHTFKMWNMAMEPHYNLFEKHQDAPFVHAGFFSNDGYNNYACTQNGQVIYSNISPKFMNPMIHTKDFSAGLEKAIVLANKHSRQDSVEKAHTLLMLCFQQSIEDSLSDVIKSSKPKTDMTAIFKKDMETYSYFTPPSYYEKFGTQLSSNLMTKIKELKINLDIQRHIKNSSSELVEIEHEILFTLKEDHLSIRMETIAELVSVILNFDAPKCYNFVIQLVEIFKNKLGLLLPIMRMLVYPSIYEKNPLHEPTTSNDGTTATPSDSNSSTPLSSSTNILQPATTTTATTSTTGKQQQQQQQQQIPPASPKVPHGTSSTPSTPKLNRLSTSIPKEVLDPEESKILEILNSPDAYIKQLSFMRGFTKILSSPTPVSDGSNPDFEDIIDYSSKNRPTIILSTSINRIYLSILAESFIYDQFYIVLLNLLSTTEGLEFNGPLKDLYDAFTPEFLSFIKNSQQRDKTKLWDSERFSTPLLTSISILFNVQQSIIPNDYYETLSTSIPVFIEELDNSFVSMLQQPDPSIPLPGKVQASQKAKAIFDQVKSLTEKQVQPATPQPEKRTSASKTASVTLSPIATNRSLALQQHIQSLNTVLNKYM
ncbi:hypothetical protein PPL_00481 [Heterostelium album PN500]|uniref:Uncharacterized protein n=1 Tax=Heterostelium pallidum (strain ATCC 26659 / Pp 5 / PN500) TaxID=670386 RepID=D3AWK6_HETP5|nr:hypothetical protein PPL_00481 [Heterostelium album PN500]EFA86679.1 hypothetical protein PPL_00481 [Heterostelium album PN500]|eukprot:XP_020438783.1 hypothetical protein PPL_00481 [Heterostelium album PN500]